MENYSWSDPPGQTAFPVAKAGHPLILAAAFVTLIFALLGMTALALIGMVVALCFCGFFRDPDRVIPDKKGGIVSPADGKVIMVDTIDNTPFFDSRCKKFGIEENPDIQNRTEHSEWPTPDAATSGQHNIGNTRHRSDQFNPTQVRPQQLIEDSFEHDVR